MHTVDYSVSARMASEKLRSLIELNGLSMAAKMKREELRVLADEYMELKRIRSRDVWCDERIQAKAHQDDIYCNYELYQLTDGTIGTSTVFYKIARDTETGALNIFWARSPEFLKAEPNKDGVRVFTNDEFRYHWDTLPASATPKDIENSIRDHHKLFREFGIFDMTMYHSSVGDLHHDSNSFEDREGHGEIYVSTNDKFAISMHEVPPQDGGGWMLKVSDPIEYPDHKQRFVPIDTIDPKHEKTKAILSNGIPIATFKKRSEAHAQMFVLEGQLSQMVWRAEDPTKIATSYNKKALVLSTKVLTTVFSFSSKEIKNPETLNEAIFDITKTIALAIAARAVLSISLPVAVAVAILGNYSDRKMLGAGLAGIRELKYRYWNGPEAFYGEKGKYVANYRENMDRRVNTKPDTSKNDILDVLDGNDIDITAITKKQKSPRLPHQGRKELIACDAKAYTRRVNIGKPLFSTDMTHNGHVRLYFVCAGNGEVESHITFQKYAAPIDINSKISLSAKGKNLLTQHEIVRLSQVKGRETANEKPVSLDEMMMEVESLIDKNYADLPRDDRMNMRNQFLWLFNNPAVSTPEEVAEREAKANPPEVREEDKVAAVKKMFGQEDIEIEKPDPDTIRFFEGCVSMSKSCALGLKL